METLKTIWDFFQNEVLGMNWLNRLIETFLNACGLDTTGKIGGSVQFFIYDTVKIMDSVTMELDSSQVLTVENYIKDKEKLFDILKNSTLKPLEYESLKFYFEDENIVFYYMPSDDSNREYNAIELNLSELENIIHEYIGEKPAS